MLSYRRLWARLVGQRSPSLDIDPACERSVDEVYNSELMSTPAVVDNSPPATISLSDAELSHAWRASYRALRLTQDPRDRARIAAARGCYLDALQERDPAGFARWVRSENAFCCDPAPFLSPQQLRLIPPDS